MTETTPGGFDEAYGKEGLSGDPYPEPDPFPGEAQEGAVEEEEP